MLGAIFMATDYVTSPMTKKGMVLYATGSSARQTVMTDKRPCDAVIMAIVDNWEVDGEHRYKKGRE